MQYSQHAADAAAGARGVGGGGGGGGAATAGSTFRNQSQKSSDSQSVITFTNSATRAGSAPFARRCDLSGWNLRSTFRQNLRREETSSLASTISFIVDSSMSTMPRAVESATSGTWISDGSRQRDSTGAAAAAAPVLLAPHPSLPCTQCNMAHRGRPSLGRCSQPRSRRNAPTTRLELPRATNGYQRKLGSAKRA